MYKMCNNDSYLTFQCLVNKQQNSNSADIFIQYFFLAKMTSVTVVKEMDICLMNKSNSYIFIFYLIGGTCE